ncbi:MAG: glycosyltransferase family 1 protein [Candidatus Sericytochromatia bacterium]|nr:glycosyltransferase family 1 protein [Candidatus Sericytochromatia bacterium]
MLERPGGRRLSHLQCKEVTNVSARQPDLVVLSHLRWFFVFQRPQHLLTRFAKERRVFYFEEPVFDVDEPTLELKEGSANLWVATPHLPARYDESMRQRALSGLLDTLLVDHGVESFVLWYYTPMMLPFTRHLRPCAVVNDCMDELSMFHGAPPSLAHLETALMQCTDVMFTGGMSLYEAKRTKHRNLHAMPSSVDVAHFAQARTGRRDPEDQAHLPHPRLGFFGVLDERLDLALIEAVALARPQWQLVIVGPVVKISESSLPRLANIHYLGAKPYTDLPNYLSGWDVAMMPFAKNDATRYISPTKTPEFLAAGRPVVSTSITDVVRPYGEHGLVRIADTADAFVAAAESCLSLDRAAWLPKVDTFLNRTSWDATWARMRDQLDLAVQLKHTRTQASDSVAELAL